MNTLELKNVSYRYSGTDKKVIKNMNYGFESGNIYAIVGKSGAGKTTLLSVLSSLATPTEGQILVNGKDISELDKYEYRSSLVGVVFQSFNLLPHLTAIENVVLSMDISGKRIPNKKERAKELLAKVRIDAEDMGRRVLKLSGGQQQRVAIARALSYDPDIILADEPTGALDSKTSVQVMELLKEVAKDRLVIMVTHNPELAEQYSTRIIRMLDGKIIDDSRPVRAEEIALEEPEQKKWGKKASMSFATAFLLSLRNLFTKKGRTLLTAFAGSIGIIGIALISAISNGMTNYIDAVQEETLTSYPLTINRTAVDLSSIMSAFSNAASENEEHETDAVYRKEAMYNMLKSMLSIEEKENDLTAFKAYLENEMEKTDEASLGNAITGISYSYDLGLRVYTQDVDGDIILCDSNALMQDVLTELVQSNPSAMSGLSGGSGMGAGSMMGGGSELWQEMLAGKNGALVSDVLEKQYDVIYGSWPNGYDEIVLVVDENNELSDTTLFALGLESRAEMKQILDDVIAGELREREGGRWSYEDICSREFRVVLNSSCYTYDEQAGVYRDLRGSDAGVRYLYDNALKLKVVGILRPKADVSSSMLGSGIGYTSALTKHVLAESAKSDAILAQMAQPSVDVIKGLPFRENTGSLSDTEKEAALREYIKQQDTKGKAEIYVTIKSIPSEELLESLVAQAMGGMNREAMEQMMLSVLVEQMGMGTDAVSAYITGMEDEVLTEMVKGMVAEGVKMQYAEQMAAQLATMERTELAYALQGELNSYTPAQFAAYYDKVMEFSDSTYEENLLELGYVDLEAPSSINIFASSFENKDKIEKAIKAYNEGKDESAQINYTDYIGILMSSVTIIINAISYVLIAFVAISLIVSSIMIGVITLISVQERTKEIGILRAIGASKRNVSNMFNAETVIIGFTAGLLGVLLSMLICVPINGIIHALTKINTINAALSLPVAITLVIISMLLTLISGIIPSKSAAKKDPVIALRTE